MAGDKQGNTQRHRETPRCSRSNGLRHYKGMAAEGVEGKNMDEAGGGAHTNGVAPRRRHAQRHKETRVTHEKSHARINN